MHQMGTFGRFGGNAKKRADIRMEPTLVAKRTPVEGISLADW
jgi:hypothetical protein